MLIFGEKVFLKSQEMIGTTGLKTPETIGRTVFEAVEAVRKLYPNAKEFMAFELGTTI